MARPGIEPRTSDLQVRCPTRPGAYHLDESTDSFRGFWIIFDSFRGFWMIFDSFKSGFWIILSLFFASGIKLL